MISNSCVLNVAALYTIAQSMPWPRYDTHRKKLFALGDSTVGV